MLLLYVQSSCALLEDVLVLTCLQISFSSAGDDQESFDATGKPSMISVSRPEPLSDLFYNSSLQIVVEHLNARAGKTSYHIY